MPLIPGTHYLSKHSVRSYYPALTPLRRLCLVICSSVFFISSLPHSNTLTCFRAYTCSLLSYCCPCIEGTELINRLLLFMYPVSFGMNFIYKEKNYLGMYQRLQVAKATPEQNLVSAFPVEYYFFNNSHIKLTEK